ncbi:MAG: 30S ribosomal protein S16 [Victivallales bacterium]|nr:30S ribosomal protein S16 [Victivallales bacterium]MCF7889544.1 30S ribosomal protein S16 [Victivallales bacterium]
MAVRIRLKRTGAKNKPCYRIVVADGRSQRDGRFIENLGYYDPRHEDESINLERANHWLSVGAQPSETVDNIIRRAKSETNPAEEEKNA